MSRISSFHQDSNIVIAGANGGIGSALVRALIDDERTGRVHAVARTPVAGESQRFHPLVADITSEAAIAEVALECSRDGPVDLVIIATGILHRGDEIRPERRMQDLDPATMAEVMRINAIAPAIAAKHFLPKMRRDGKSVFAAISARVGSIGDNRLGGWASYRASKAALNMFIRTLAIEHGRTHPDSLVVALHPGTTDTALSKPFQRNVPGDKLFPADYTAERLLQVLDGLSSNDTGGFFAWSGDRIEY